MIRIFLFILCIISISVLASSPVERNASREVSFSDEEQVIPQTPASYEDSILAVVNNEIISSHDLNTFLRMLTQGNLNSIPKEQLPAIRQTALNKLIGEMLMLQAIERAHIPVPAQEIEEMIAHTEQARNLPAGKIHRDMKALGIPPEVYTRQFKAQLGWGKYIRSAFQQNAHVSEKDIEESIALQQNKPRYLLSEIRLAIMKPSQQESARKAALHMIAQIEKGTPFSDIAQQVSHAPSALNGGDIGWVLESQLPEWTTPNTVEILKSLPINKVSPPILNKDKTCYTIYLLRDKIIPGKTASPFVVARQLNIKLDPTKDPQQQLQDLRKKFEGITTCQQFEALDDQIPNAQLNIYNEIRLSDMSKDLQTALKDLAVGQVSSGLINDEDNTAVFFMVCSRYESAIPPEAKAEASELLTDRRMGIIAEQKIHDLQRASLIDVRI